MKHSCKRCTTEWDVTGLSEDDFRAICGFRSCVNYPAIHRLCETDRGLSPIDTKSILIHSTGEDGKCVGCGKILSAVGFVECRECKSFNYHFLVCSPE